MERPSARSVRELADLSGRRALVAGGSGHVGAAAVGALRESGAAVAVCDLEPPPGDTPFVACDLADEASARAAVHAAAEALGGGLDVLVHCAALVGTSELDGWAVPFEQQSAAAWEAALRVNLTSAFVLVQEARPLLAASGRGSVVLFGSIYGVVGPNPALYEGTEMASPTAYGASKGALVQLVRSLATQLAPEVRVNAVSPGGIERGQPAAFRERYEAATPLRRMATEEDVKGAVAFLAGDLSAYVTGQNLLVDGGWTAW